MGPTLARMAKRASEAAGIKRRMIGVSRFSPSALELQLNAWGVETIQCDSAGSGGLVNAIPECRRTLSSWRV